MSAAFEALALRAIERGWLPDPLVRVGIRRLPGDTLARERKGGEAAIRARRVALLREMRGSPIALHTADANRQHYELPAEYFRLVLGPHLKYSCGLWSLGARTLAESEEAMLALTAARAGIADGQRILDLGCGWGSLLLWLAERFPNARITAVSNSAGQRAFIEARTAERGLTNLCAVTADMNVFTPERSFDRIVSVEMFEHMRNWPRLLERVAWWLAPGGALFVHVFCHRDLAYRFETGTRSDWMARHFFTGGLMPSANLLASVSGPLRVVRQWHVSGAEYAATCRAWLERHDAQRAAILPLFREVYGEGAGRWFVRWRLFYLACAGLFEHTGGTEWFVTHTLLESRRTP